MSRQSTIKTLALDAGGFGDLGNALSLREMPESDQENTRLILVFQSGFEVLRGKTRVLAEATNDSLVVGNAGFAFHGVFVLSL